MAKHTVTRFTTNVGPIWFGQFEQDTWFMRGICTIHTTWPETPPCPKCNPQLIDILSKLSKLSYHDAHQYLVSTYPAFVYIGENNGSSVT